jgi:hypothetical protein
MNHESTLKWLASGGINLQSDYPGHLLSILDTFLTQTSKTYGFLQQTALLSDLITFGGRPRSTGRAPLIMLDGIYCPSIDADMGESIRVFLYYFPSVYQRPFEGGKKQLGSLSPASKLYVICHGHSEMPLFKTGTGSWTAAQLAGLMESDGLRKDHRVIELLVCHAGASVTSISAGQHRLALRAKAQKAQKAGRTRRVEKLKAEYGKVRGPGPAEYSNVKQILPMCAQFIDALKKNKYSYIRVISYACPVAQYYVGGQVHLDLRSRGGQWGVRASEHPDLVKVWL